MSDRIARVEAFTLTIPRETPYLGPPQPGEAPNARGYMVRRGNRTVYPMFDRSILVRVETAHGVVGWGETYGIVAPGAVLALIADLYADFTIGRDACAPAAIHDDLYDLMRVRGYTGGFALDALAAIDIALWDVASRIAGLALAQMLGGRRRTSVPAYVSGLPRETRAERAALAQAWRDRGFNAFKFAAPVADDGVALEMAGLRAALGPDARIACDLHWAQPAHEAAALIRAMEPHSLWFAEAPVRTEDVAGLAQVGRSVQAAIAVGEEWRTVHDMVHRLAAARIDIVQPEMGHKGVTEFMRIGALAHAHHIDVIPHATIGAGIFLAASLQCSAALPGIVAHEYQHSIFEPNRRLLDGGMDCAAGAYTPPDGPGLGVTPSPEALRLMERA